PQRPRPPGLPRRLTWDSGASRSGRPLLLRQKRLRLNELGALGVSLGAQDDQLLVELPRLRSIADSLGGLASAVERTEPVWRRPQGGLKFGHGLAWLVQLKEHLAQQFPHRNQPVLHRDVLLAPVLEVGGGAHRGQRLIPAAFGARHPRRRGQSLNLHLLRPVAVRRLAERIPERLQPVNLSPSGRDVAAASGAEGPAEVRDGLGGREAARTWIDHGGPRPAPALDRIADG